MVRAFSASFASLLLRRSIVLVGAAFALLFACVCAPGTAAAAAVAPPAPQPLGMAIGIAAESGDLGLALDLACDSAAAGPDTSTYLVAWFAPGFSMPVLGGCEFVQMSDATANALTAIGAGSIVCRRAIWSE